MIFSRILKMSMDTGNLLFQMQKNNSMTDITFVVQGKEVKAHKNVVCCRGGKLKEMVENNPKTAHIKEINLATFNAVLE